jgi:hypothetical protein
MKTKLLIAGMFSIILAFGITAVGCDLNVKDDDSSGGTSSKPISLTENTWHNNTFSSADETHYYRFSANAETTYYIRWDDQHQGSGSKTSDVYVSADYPNGTSAFYRRDSGYATAVSITPSTSGYVTIVVTGGTGTYAIMYYTDNSSGGGGTNTNSFDLTDNTWYDNSFTPITQSHSYKFYANAGTTYYIRWDDRDQGSGSKTSDVYVSADYPNGPCAFYRRDDGYATAVSITPSVSGYITIAVTGGTGTYAVLYFQ